MRGRGRPGSWPRMIRPLRSSALDISAQPDAEEPLAEQLVVTDADEGAAAEQARNAGGQAEGELVAAGRRVPGAGAALFARPAAPGGPREGLDAEARARHRERELDRDGHGG